LSLRAKVHWKMKPILARKGGGIRGKMILMSKSGRGKKA